MSQFVKAVLFALAMGEVNGELTSLVGQLQFLRFDPVLKFSQSLPLDVEIGSF